MRTFEEFEKEIDSLAESLNSNKLEGADYRAYLHGVWKAKAYELYCTLNDVNKLIEKHFGK